MRIREILQEDYNQSLQSDLSNLLIGAKGSGASEVSTPDIVSQLRGMGYSVSPDSIITLLSNNPAVLNATPEMIKLSEPEAAEMGSEEDSAARVADMAQQASDKVK